MRKIVTGLLLSFILISILAQSFNQAAQDSETQKPVKVFTKEIEPFDFLRVSK